MTATHETVASAARRAWRISSQKRSSAAGVSTHSENGGGWLIWSTSPLMSEHRSHAVIAAARYPADRQPVSAWASAYAAAIASPAHSGSR